MFTKTQTQNKILFKINFPNWFYQTGKNSWNTIIEVVLLACQSKLLSWNMSLEFDKLRIRQIVTLNLTVIMIINAFAGDIWSMGESHFNSVISESLSFEVLLVNRLTTGAAGEHATYKHCNMQIVTWQAINYIWYMFYKLESISALNQHCQKLGVQSTLTWPPTPANLWFNRKHSGMECEIN